MGNNILYIYIYIYINNITKDIVVEKLSLGYDGFDIVNDSKLVITAGHKYGLIGKNGTGKSTLMRAIFNKTIIGFPRSLHIEYVEQVNYHIITKLL